MNYEETLEKIHGYHAFQKRPGLERITELMKILGDPQDSLSVVHVAGTNGKGSVCRYLYSVLERMGYACGLYTSPYIERFTERIQFHGGQISEEDLIRIGAQVFAAAETMVERGLEEPTEFDVVTAIAFVYFAEKKADYVVLEVGLGGRLDATNVVSRPLATVITSISLDHMAVLGDTLPQIAGEKAGIVKPDVPVVFAVKDENAARVICETAEEQNPKAPVYDVFGTAFPACAKVTAPVVKKLGGYCFTSQILGYTYSTMELSMTGIHQVENALCALTALELLRQRGRIFPQSGEAWEKAVRLGMKDAGQPGRFELISQNPAVILDGAHNQDGVRSLCLSLQEHFAHKRILLVLGVLKDKALTPMLEELRPLLETAEITFLAAEPENPRKLPAKELADAVKTNLGVDCGFTGDWKTALAAVRENGCDYDAVVFAGSFYLIGSIREGWRKDDEKSIAGV